MKVTPDSRRRYCLARISLFLVMTALIAGLAGCIHDTDSDGDSDGNGDGNYYVLSIASTVGGSVTAPGEGDFSYPSNMVVRLVAQPHEHYHFLKWTGAVSTIPDVSAALTNITMKRYYCITANFELDEDWHSLTVSSTVGGSVTNPGEGTFLYGDGMVVNLATADAEQGYRFVDWIGDVDAIDDASNATTSITMLDSYSVTADFGLDTAVSATPMVDTGRYQTVGLKSDGTVVATGPNHYGECNVSGWRGIIEVAAGWYHTVGGA
jgi:hypothetical protein